MLGRIASKAAKKLIGVKKKKRKAPDPRTLDHSENLKIRAERKKAGLTPDGYPKPKRKNKKRKTNTTADSARKVEGKNTADLTQPAGGSAGRTMDQADAGIRSSQRAARKATDFDRAIKKKKTALNKYQKKRDSLKGKDKIKFIHENQQRIKDLKASIADMERRGGPRVNRKTGGKVMKKAAGGKMSHVGLYPAEEARSGTMSEKKRAKHMKHGGKVHRNTSRENRLEELGRVDAEKAHTRKGKRNLRAEKKRIVHELNGNDFVASHYD